MTQPFDVGSIVETLYVQLKNTDDRFLAVHPEVLDALRSSGEITRIFYDIPKFRAKIRGNGLLLADAKPFDSLTNVSVKEFLECALSMGFSYQMWIHPKNQNKTEIGYGHEEIAITLAYAGDLSTTTYFIFTRNNPIKLGGKISRSIIRKLAGVRDLAAAAKQAATNLDGLMQAGNIGPFGLKQNDRIYVDLSSYSQSLNNRELLVNFPSGHDMLSFNMRLKEAYLVLGKIYIGRTDIKDLWQRGYDSDDSSVLKFPKI